MSKPAEWLRSGTGMAPRVAWSFVTDAELVDVTCSRETGHVFAADAVGGLYRLSSTGRVEVLSRGSKETRQLRFDDRGEAGVIIHGRDSFSVLDARMKPLWSADSPCAIQSVAIDAWGHNIAMSLDNGDAVTMNVDRKKLGQFHTLRPLKHIAFCSEKARIIGAADYGLICSHHFDGQEIWTEKLSSTVGDLSITDNGRSIVVAGYAHGIQCYDEHGSTRASYIMERGPSRVSISAFGDRLVAATVERHLYWLDADGTLLWAAETPEDVKRLICDPLGEWIVLGLQSGRIMRLDWELPR